MRSGRRSASKVLGLIVIFGWLIASTAWGQDDSLSLTLMAKDGGDGEYPHAWVVLSVKTRSGIKEEAYGFYPTEDKTGGDDSPKVLVLSAKKMVRGEVKREFSERSLNSNDAPRRYGTDPRPFSRTSVSLKRNVTSTQRENVMRTITGWQGKCTPTETTSMPCYNWVKQNCIALVHDVAQVAGFNVPPTFKGLVPAWYLYILDVMNSNAWNKASELFGGDALHNLENLRSTTQSQSTAWMRYRGEEEGRYRTQAAAVEQARQKVLVSKSQENAKKSAQADAERQKVEAAIRSMKARIEEGRGPCINCGSVLVGPGVEGGGSGTSSSSTPSSCGPVLACFLTEVFLPKNQEEKP